MYLLEHDAKELLAKHGIAVPQGVLIEREEAISRSAIGAGPWIVKGQVATGGRGKAGIIQKAATPREVNRCVNSILGTTIAGRIVETVRIEHQVSDAREAYIGLLLD